MKLNELVEKYKKLEGVWNTEGAELARQIFLQDLEQLDEPETGHADEAPRYVKNILARLRELPVHDREVWLKAIMGEFEKDFSHAKWREGHEVEKEKKYKVVLLNYNDGHLNLVNVRTLGENIIFFTKKTQFDQRSLKLTKAEIISSGFGWVFDCPGVEVEEVK
jgi:hypothetical protein|nr:MAG TPA: Protein of unknown function (DUF1642) [Caudoviricetes sp.]